MSEEKLQAVRDYLAKHFPGRQIEEKHDFDVDARAFKILVAEGTHLLKVGRLFIDDNSADGITDLLNSWEVAEVLAKEHALGILITQEGPETFDRD